MRASNLGAFVIGPLAALSLAACAGEAPAGPTTGTAEAESCSLPASCQAVSRECIGLVDNSGASRFGLRISQIDVSRPARLTEGILGLTVAEDALPSNLACNLNGSGTFSWLLRFDLAQGTLETGGAAPVADAEGGYRFVDEEILGRQVAPVTYALTMGGDGAFSVAEGQDLLLPIYLDEGGRVPVVFPLTAARFAGGTLSSSQSCIGRYDPAALDPANDCFAGGADHAFVDGATVEGLLTLEDADTVVVPSAATSLCVVLSGDPGAYGVANAEGITVCRRDASGGIVLRGDACSVAGQTCADAFAVSAGVAASSVLIDD